MIITPSTATASWTRPGRTYPYAPALPTAPVAVVRATDPTAPIFQFPGIATGDKFAIAKGSKVGFLEPKGSADLERFEGNAAAFRVLASAFGVKVEIAVTVERIGDDLVRITQQQPGKEPTSAEGRIVASRENYAEFVGTDAAATKTIIQHDGAGMITIDTAIPTFGNAHLVLQKLV